MDIPVERMAEKQKSVMPIQKVTYIVKELSRVSSKAEFLISKVNRHIM